MGVLPELNHTTSTQFDGWKETIVEFCTSHRKNPDTKFPIEPAKVWQLTRGYLGDHAADQKKLSGTLENFHRECDREVRGEEALFSDDQRDEAERNQLFNEKSEEMFEKAGGKEQWASLLPQDHLRYTREMVRQVQIALGELPYQRLSPEEQAEVDFWVYTGCVMHKDLNAAKGGVERMSKSWDEKKSAPPIALMNKAKEKAAESSLACNNGKGVRRPERGAVKLTSLLGALIKHKNPKKGHQVRFRVFC